MNFIFIFSACKANQMLTNHYSIEPIFLHAKQIKCSRSNHKIEANYHWKCPLFCSFFYLIEGHRTKRRGIHRCYSCTQRSPFYLLLNQQCFIPLPHERRPDRTQKSKHIILPQENADERA